MGEKQAQTIPGTSICRTVKTEAPLDVNTDISQQNHF